MKNLIERSYTYHDVMAQFFGHFLNLSDIKYVKLLNWVENSNSNHCFHFVYSPRKN